MNNSTKRCIRKRKNVRSKKRKIRKSAKQHIFFKFHIKAQKTFGLGQIKINFSTKSINKHFFFHFWPKQKKAMIEHMKNKKKLSDLCYFDDVLMLF